MTRKTRVIIGAVFIIIGFIVLNIYFDMNILPIAEEIAKSDAKDLALEIINDGVEESIKNGYEMSDFGEVIYAGDGSPVSVTANMQSINLIKSEISKKIFALSRSAKDRIVIPFGNLTGIKWLSGKGGDIEVKVIPVTSVTTDIKTDFVECGINQTRYTVCLVVSVEGCVLIGGRNVGFVTENTVILFDSVIVGKVPGAYTKLERAGSDLMGDVMDFGAK